MARDNINDKNRVRRGFYSVKNQRHMLVDSYLEFKFLLMLEFWDAVKQYRSHPVKTIYTDRHGKKRTYIPDLFLLFHNGKGQFIEVKPYHRTLSCEFNLQVMCLDRHFQKLYKAPFKIVTDENIHSARLSNCERLYSYKRKPVDQQARDWSNQFQTLSLPFAEIKSACQKDSLPAHVPFSLLAHQVFKFDFNTKLSNTTLLEVT